MGAPFPGLLPGGEAATEGTPRVTHQPPPPVHRPPAGCRLPLEKPPPPGLRPLPAKAETPAAPACGPVAVASCPPGTVRYRRPGAGRIRPEAAPVSRSGDPASSCPRSERRSRAQSTETGDRPDRGGRCLAWPRLLGAGGPRAHCSFPASLSEGLRRRPKSPEWEGVAKTPPFGKPLIGRGAGGVIRGYEDMKSVGRAEGGRGAQARAGTPPGQRCPTGALLETPVLAPRPPSPSAARHPAPLPLPCPPPPQRPRPGPRASSRLAPLRLASGDPRLLRRWPVAAGGRVPLQRAGLPR